MTSLRRKLLATQNCASYGYNAGIPYFIVGPTDLDIGCSSATIFKQGNALLFPDIEIPPGQVIKYAYITYFAWGNYINDFCNARLYGEKSLIPVPFSTWADFQARPKTVNKLPWDSIPHWDYNNPYNTPNIAPIIQEIISQPGWASGNPIVLFCDDLEDRSTHTPPSTRHGWAYYEHYEWAAELTIEYGPETNFAIVDIGYTPLQDTIQINITTQIPCHLTCYYTNVQPQKHPRERVIRGASLPWGTYFCFVAWKAIEQTEPGDTLTHTFIFPEWPICQFLWFTFRGTAIDLESPSVGPIFMKHHGRTSNTLILRPWSPGDACFITRQAGDPCPDHWKNVNDIVPDEAATTIYESSRPGYTWDFYNIQDPPDLNAFIRQITVVTRCRANTIATVPSIHIIINIDGQYFDKIHQFDPTIANPWNAAAFWAHTNWFNSKAVWPLNPATGNPWTWAQIKNLQIGVALRNPRHIAPTLGKYTYCTQVYAEIEYDTLT